MFEIIRFKGNNSAGYAKGRNGYYKPYSIAITAADGTDHVRLAVAGAKGVDNAILSLPVAEWPAIIRALQAAVKAAKAHK